MNHSNWLFIINIIKGMNDIFQLKLDLIDEKQRKNDYIIS
jgi:hypothetical protein